MISEDIMGRPKLVAQIGVMVLLAIVVQSVPLVQDSTMMNLTKEIEGGNPAEVPNQVDTVGPAHGADTTQTEEGMDTGGLETSSTPGQANTEETTTVGPPQENSTLNDAFLTVESSTVERYAEEPSCNMSCKTNAVEHPVLQAGQPNNTRDMGCNDTTADGHQDVSVPDVTSHDLPGENTIGEELNTEHKTIPVDPTSTQTNQVDINEVTNGSDPTMEGFSEVVANVEITEMKSNQNTIVDDTFSEAATNVNSVKLIPYLDGNDSMANVNSDNASYDKTSSTNTDMLEKTTNASAKEVINIENELPKEKEIAQKLISDDINSTNIEDVNKIENSSENLYHLGDGEATENAVESGDKSFGDANCTTCAKEFSQGLNVFVVWSADKSTVNGIETAGVVPDNTTAVNGQKLNISSPAAEAQEKTLEESSEAESHESSVDVNKLSEEASNISPVLATMNELTDTEDKPCQANSTELPEDTATSEDHKNSKERFLLVNLLNQIVEKLIPIIKSKTQDNELNR